MELQITTTLTDINLVLPSITDAIYDLFEFNSLIDIVRKDKQAQVSFSLPKMSIKNREILLSYIELELDLIGSFSTNTKTI